MRRLVFCVLLVMAALSLGLSPARADGSVEVNFDSFAPSLLRLDQPDQVVTLTGTVRNTTSDTLTDLTIHFWRDTEPLVSLDDLDTALASSPENPLGRRLLNEANVMFVEALAPGESTTFQVSATIGDLTLDQDDAVYLLGVHVRATRENRGRTTVGRGRILAPATTAKLPVASVVKLTHRPTLFGERNFVDHSLAQRIEGDLDALLSAAEEPHRLLLVDPALLAELSVLASDHEVAGAEEPGNPLAGRFVERVRTLISQGRVIRLPFGNPDLPRLHATGSLSEFETALGWSETALQASEMAQLASLPLAADLGNHANEDLALILARSGYRWVLGDNLVSSGTIGGSSTSGLLVDPLGRPGIGPGSTTSPVQVTQRRLADEILRGNTRVHLARSASELTRLPLIPDAETPVALPVPREAAHFEVDPASATPWRSLLTRSQELFSESQLLEELTGTDRTGLNATRAALANSADFDSEKEALEFISAHPSGDVDAAQIRLTSASQFVMGSDRNVFPMTVSNPLQEPVRLRVEFTSNSPTRIYIPATEVVTIAPGEQQTVSIAPVAKANGVVTVSAQLSTPSGTRFGPVIPVEVTATGFGRVGWIIIIVSGAVVLGGTLLRIRTVQKEQARESREQ